MKQIILLAFLMACSNATAQINHPLVEEGKVWYYKGIYSWGGYKVWEEIYSLEGDTVIDSHQCLKLYLTCNNPRKSYDHDYIGAMYEKGGKVYYIVPDNTTSAVLYDFSCDVGDKITMNLYDIYMPNIVKYDEFDMIINDKQLVEYRDENLTVMNWSPFFKLTEDVVGFCTIWIEGVGSPLDLLNNTPVWYTGIYSSRELLTCKLNDQIIYDKDEFMEYYPAPEQRCFTKGTKWTEIRLDTLKYDNWYSKDGDEWVPNYETVEYSVEYRTWGFEGKSSDYVFINDVYTNGPDWSDSLLFALYEFHREDDIYIDAFSHNSSARAYQFNWFVGKELYYQISSTKYPYGTIEEIKEGDFGGVRPLKYVDLNGVRIIQGIGVTEWDDGECLFGPAKLYRYSSPQGTLPERHYHSMLVHFERNGEVLYDVWPEKTTTGIGATLNDKGKMTNDSRYDLSGRKLAGKPARGIYIENGKKKVK